MLKTRKDLVAEIKAAKDKLPTTISGGGLPSRRDLNNALKDARKRSKLISRAANVQLQSDTLRTRVDATRTQHTAPKSEPDVHPDIAKLNELEVAWDRLMKARDEEGIPGYRRVYNEHAKLFKSTSRIRKAAELAEQSQNQ